jgi:hypothetical protein
MVNLMIAILLIGHMKFGIWTTLGLCGGACFFTVIDLLMANTD